MLDSLRRGFACLAPLGLSFDAWLFHPQIGELADLARAFPHTKIVLDHCGGPIGIGSSAGRREKSFRYGKPRSCRSPNAKTSWSNSAASRCACSAMTFTSGRSPLLRGTAAAWRPYIEISSRPSGRTDKFPKQFPPDKGQCSYQVIFNAFKRLAAQYSEAEKTALFSKTATDFYKLKLRC